MLLSPGIGWRRDRSLLRISILLAALTFVTAFAPAQQLDWIRQFADGGTSGDTWVADVKVAGGFVYVAGTIATFPVVDCFVRKFDLAGNAIWTDVFGTADNDDVTTLTVDGGTIYVGGTTLGEFV